MLQSYSAYTYEIDDAKQAVQEILEQLNIEGNTARYSVGIVSCFAEFIDSGVIKELCHRLPFPVVGTTTIANSSNSIVGETMLNILVLTSDDVEISVGLSDSINDEEPSVLNSVYEKASSSLSGKPDFMLTYAPLIYNVSLDFYVDTFNEISEQVPNFGTLAVDHTEDYSEAQVIFSGEAYTDRCAVVLMHGDIKPKFYIGNVSKERVFSEKGAVTASQGNLLKMVNGAPVLEYLQSLGLEADENGVVTGINTFPLIVDYNDGSLPIARAMIAITPEGYAVCGGKISEGATLSIGAFDPDEIRNTAERIIETALKENPNSSFIIYSCVGRYFAQGDDLLREAECISQKMKEAKYMFAYAGGEISPVYTRDNNTSNRSHNISIVICAV